MIVIKSMQPPKVSQGCNFITILINYGNKPVIQLDIGSKKKRKHYVVSSWLLFSFPDYTGASCQLLKDHCSRDVCGQGSCNLDGHGFTCDCTSGGLEINFFCRLIYEILLRIVTKLLIVNARPTDDLIF